MDQKKTLSFLTLWVGLTISLLILSVMLGGNLVLGNMSITKPVAGLIFGLVLTAVYFLTGPAATKLNIRVKDEKAWTLVFFIGNVIIIWTVKRLATITAVGISSIFFVLVIAAVITLVEKGIDRYSQKTLGKK